MRCLSSFSIMNQVAIRHRLTTKCMPIAYLLQYILCAFITILLHCPPHWVFLKKLHPISHCWASLLATRVLPRNSYQIEGLYLWRYGTTTTTFYCILLNACKKTISSLILLHLCYRTINTAHEWWESFSSISDSLQTFSFCSTIFFMSTISYLLLLIYFASWSDNNTY